MLGIVVALILLAALVVISVRFRRLRQQLQATQVRTARLEKATEILAEATVTDIIADALNEPPVPRQHRHRRHLRLLPVWLTGAGVAAWAWARRQPALAGELALVTAAGITATVLLPVLASPEPTDPGTVEPPPAAAPPLDTYPNLPPPAVDVPQPEPRLRAPDPAPDPDSQPAAVAPPMQQVAVEQPTTVAPPQADPPEVSPPPPTPAPDPEPEPDPVPPLEPPAEPADDPLLLCAELGLLRLIRLELCL